MAALLFEVMNRDGHNSRWKDGDLAVGGWWFDDNLLEFMSLLCGCMIVFYGYGFTASCCHGDDFFFCVCMGLYVESGVWQS